MTVTDREQRGCMKIEPFQKKMALIKRWADELKEALSQFDDVHFARSDRVENEWYDGFFPYTDGGFDIIATADLGLAEGSGTTPKMLEATLASTHKDCAEEWDRQHPELTYDMIFNADRDDPDQLMLPGHPPRPEPFEVQHEEYQQFADQWMRKGLTYFYKARVLLYSTTNPRNETGEHEVLFCVALNDDFEYGRDSIGWLRSPSNGGPGSHWLWEKTVKLKNLTEKRVDTLTKQAIAALGDA